MSVNEVCGVLLCCEAGKHKERMVADCRPWKSLASTIREPLDRSSCTLFSHLWRLSASDSCTFWVGDPPLLTILLTVTTPSSILYWASQLNPAPETRLSALGLPSSCSCYFPSQDNISFTGPKFLIRTS